MDFKPDDNGFDKLLQQAQERANVAFSEALNREVSGATTYEQIEQGVLRASADVFGEPMPFESAAEIARTIAAQSGIPTE
ncbi:Uncharacterised protein [Rhodococcus gordoniae]|uniref:Uncharacterized protein n=1 Tax=Rhodococcus gordoniae TaxID=223392 RepID=A0A379LZF8_9NOCA|nr:hypothetical protein [Rhodococcus gordoniae]SUE14688.1 Uncharacterised protein [Rhodococcus gordoniae]